MEFEQPMSPHNQPPSSRFTQALLDSLPCQTAVLDASGHILQVNGAWTRAGEQGGSPPRGGVGVDYIQASETAEGAEGLAMARGLQRVLQGQRPSFALEYPSRTQTGPGWFLMRVQAFHDGPQSYALVTHEDVSERRLARLRQDQLDEEVQQAVAARTSILSEANRDLEAFAASVSHDLRAPVRHIQGFLRSLHQRLLGRMRPDEDYLFETLEGSAGRLGVMIEELLGLARVGKQPMTHAPLSLEQVFERAQKHLAPETAHRAVEWQIHPLPEVQGDARLLEYAVVNLLSNALKYTAQGQSAQIEVTASDTGGEWVIAVQDNGVGFDTRFVDRLFTPFQRLHSERDYQGVGMGLANVKRIVERHGGRVWAEGQPGVGATFSFSLPK